MGEYLAFRKFVTPAFIQVIFWVLEVVNVLVWVGIMIAGCASASSTDAFGNSNGSTGGAALIFLGSLVGLVFYALFIRIWMELLIVIFRIYDSAKSIESALTAGRGPSPAFAGVPQGPAMMPPMGGGQFGPPAGGPPAAPPAQMAPPAPPAAPPSPPAPPMPPASTDQPQQY
jgi:hypothetical protein